MKVTKHRDGTYSLTGLTRSGLSVLHLGTSSVHVDYYRDWDLLASGKTPHSLWAQDGDREWLTNYARETADTADQLYRIIRDRLYQ